MSAEVPITERRPELGNLLRSEAQLASLLPLFEIGQVRAADLFEVDGQLLFRIAQPVEKIALPDWPEIPAQARSLLAQRKYERTCLRWRGVPFELRTLNAGADRVGIVLYTLAADDQEGGNQQSQASKAVVEALHGVLQSLVQAGYAAWVTSEMHLATSESSYQQLQSQHAELLRALEHLREVDKLKSNFLATISHELRTPLTSVIGFAEMLLKEIAGPLNEEQREYAVTIFERGDELLRMISQLLDMSRMDAGPPQVHLESCSVDDIVRRSLRTVQIDANRARVSLSYEARGESLPEITADGAKIQQILVNLVGNAIKFSPVGAQVKVRAELGPRRRPFDEEQMFGAEEHDAIVVRVCDSGIGISQDQLEKIFEAFYQVNGGATRQHGGAGLGLSIVRKLVDAHDGEVWVESEVGVGTTFSFTIPLDRSLTGESPTNFDSRSR